MLDRQVLFSFQSLNFIKIKTQHQQFVVYIKKKHFNKCKQGHLVCISFIMKYCWFLIRPFAMEKSIILKPSDYSDTNRLWIMLQSLLRQISVDTSIGTSALLIKKMIGYANYVLGKAEFELNTNRIAKELKKIYWTVWYSAIIWLVYILKRYSVISLNYCNMTYQ